MSNVFSLFGKSVPKPPSSHGGCGCAGCGFELLTLLTAALVAVKLVRR